MPKNFTAAQTKPFRTHLAPNGNILQIINVKEVSNILDVPKDVSAIEPDDNNEYENYHKNISNGPVKITKSNYEICDAMLEPIEQKDNFKAIKNYNTFTNEPQTIFVQKAIFGDEKEERKNGKITQNNQIETTKPQKLTTDTLFNKSIKSSDYEIQNFSNGVIQKQSDTKKPDTNHHYSDSNTILTHNTPQIAQNKRPQLYTTEAKRLIGQKTRNYAVSVSKPIVNNFKKQKAHKETKNYNFTQQHKISNDTANPQVQIFALEETVSNLKEQLFRKESEIAFLNNTIKNSKKEVENLKEEVSVSKFEGSYAITNHRKAAERIDELNSQLDAARLRLQTTSEKFGKLIDYIYRLNNPEYLNVLEDIVGGKNRTDLEDVYKKYENLKRKMAEMTDLMYMSRDRTLIDKVEEINKLK